MNRHSFQTACEAFITIHTSWSWKDNCMSRTVVSPITQKLDDNDAPDHEEHGLIDEVDECVALPPKGDTVVCRQYVVISPTFQVPTFYFTMHSSTGSPLSSSEIIQTPLFRRFHPSPSTYTTSFAVSSSEDTSNFPILSQADHPFLSTPCWVLHPCHTKEAVEELMREKGYGNNQERWLEVWFIVLGTIVDLDA